MNGDNLMATDGLTAAEPADTALPGVPRRSSWLAPVAKVLLAAAVLYWLVHSGQLKADDFRAIELGLPQILALLLAAGAVVAGLVLLAVRFDLLLRHQGIEVRFRRVMAATALGALFGSVLPGLVGGDAVKAAYVYAGTRRRGMSVVMAALVDRLVGMYALFVLGALTWLAAWPSAELSAITRALPIAPAVAVGGALALPLLGWEPLLSGRLARRLHALLPRTLQSLLSAARAYLTAPRILLAAVVLGVANHALVVLSFVVADRLLPHPLSLRVCLLLSPLAMVINAIPLTPGGIGLTEGAFAHLFRMAGSPSGAAVGILGRAIQYVAFAVAGTLALVAPGDDGGVPAVLAETGLGVRSDASG